MTRNTALRLVAMALTSLLWSPALGVVHGPGLFVAWGLSTVILGNVAVALFGTTGRYPSGGDL